MKIAAYLILITVPLFSIAEQSEEATANLERMVITGSRLERLEFEAPQPVIVFTREELLASGYGTIADFADKLRFTVGTDAEMEKTIEVMGAFMRA